MYACNVFQQLPSMLFISVLIVVTGLAWPYKDAISSVLDLLLSVDVMLLLLLRNTGQIKGSLNDVIIERKGSANQCVDYNVKPSTLLLPFYYFPSLLLIIIIVAWITFLIRYV